MRRSICTTLQLAVLQGAACEFDLELTHMVIEYSDDKPGYEPEIIAVYVSIKGARNDLPVWMIDAMGEQLVDLCKRDSALCHDDDLAEMAMRRQIAAE